MPNRSNGYFRDTNRKHLYMCDIKTTLNTLGLVLTLVGAYVVYKNSPINEHSIDGGEFSNDDKAIEDTTSRKNRLMRYGVFAVMGGTFLQLVSNYVPARA